MNPRLVIFSVIQVVLIWLFFGSFIALFRYGVMPDELTSDVLKSMEFKRSEIIPWPKAGDRGNAEYFIYTLKVEEYAFPGKIEEGTRYRRINGKDPRAPNRQLIFVSELSIPILFAARFVGHFVSTVILALIVFSAGRAKIAD